jgi:hypothetical protein
VDPEAGKKAGGRRWGFGRRKETPGADKRPPEPPPAAPPEPTIPDPALAPPGYHVYRPSSADRPTAGDPFPEDDDG